MTRNSWFVVAVATLILFARSSMVVQAANSPTNIVYENTKLLPAVADVSPACDCDACQTAEDATFDIFVPKMCSAFECSAGVLLLRPGADNLGYATVTTFRNPTVPVPIASPLWHVEALDPDYQPGFQLGARYIFPCSGNDVQLSWEHLRTADSTSVTVDNPTEQWVSPFSQTGPPNPADPTEIGVFYLKSAQGQVRFAYDATNLDFGQYINFGSHTQLRIFSGLSYARLQEKLVSTFYATTPPAPLPDPLLSSISISNTSSYEGFGPRFGLKYMRETSYGFNFIGQLAGAILVGQMHPAAYSFTGTSRDLGTGNVFVNHEQISSDSVAQIVYSCDAKIGIGYSYVLANGSKLNLAASFGGAMYINPFSTYETSTNVLPLEVGSLSTNSMRHTPSNFWVHGFYLTSELTW